MACLHVAIFSGTGREHDDRLSMTLLYTVEH